MDNSRAEFGASERGGASLLACPPPILRSLTATRLTLSLLSAPHYP